MTDQCFCVFYSGDFVVSAPSIMRWDIEEKVIVTVSGNSGDVVLFMQDYPDRKNTFSQQTKQVNVNSGK